jgi:hypothetical protein
MRYQSVDREKSISNENVGNLGVGQKIYCQHVQNSACNCTTVQRSLGSTDSAVVNEDLGLGKHQNWGIAQNML